LKRVFGCAAFGLRDCVWQPDQGCIRKDFYLADVVLPKTHFGKTLTGSEAKQERIHTGLYWPPEARVQAGKFLRRVPVPYSWRALVEAGDRMIRWKVGDGVSFPLSHIISCHIKDILEKQKSNFSKDQDSIVVAIPDNLDEYGQELLIKELHKKLSLHKREKQKQEQVILIWRPIAAALAWLDKVEGDFIPKKMTEEDHIHVLYLGPDAVEISTFRLKVKPDKNGFLYVLPLRERPSYLPILTGMDWIGRVIEETFDWPDEGDFWQAFTRFPEIWAAVANLTWNKKERPHVWSTESGWTFWDPPKDLSKKALSVPAGPCTTLREICRNSCPLSSQRDSNVEESINQFLKKEVRELSKKHSGGRLYGMILCGPLMSNGIPPWLESELETLAARGLRLDGPLDEPELGRLWISPHSEEAVAEGAAIYGNRLIKGIPTYLDTMPQISILAQYLGGYKWIPLLDAEEVLGGETYEGRIKGKFQLNRGQQKLHVYLRKGPPQKQGVYSENIDDEGVRLSEHLSPCEGRLLRQIVRSCGSLEKVRKLPFFRAENAAASYGLAFAAALYRDRPGDKVNRLREGDVEPSKHPFRKAVFYFPSAPSKDMPLDIFVRMKPASGLAQIEIKPEDSGFLKGRKVFLEYSVMKGTFKIPKPDRGWPRIREICVDPEDSVLRQWNNFIARFEKVDIQNPVYSRIIDRIRDLLKKQVPVIRAGKEIFTHIIDQHGQPCTKYGRQFITRLSLKIDSDFKMLEKSKFQNYHLINKLFVRATWLYASTPPSVVDYLRNILLKGQYDKTWNWAVEAASRSFTEVKDFNLLFDAIERRALREELPHPFPLQSIRAVCRVLMYREDGYLGLDCEKAQLFARRALMILGEQQSEKKYKQLFFQLILLLLFLLRYRKAEPSCFDPARKESIAVFQTVENLLIAAHKYFHSRRQTGKANRIKAVIDGLNRYLYYEGGEEVVTIISELAGDLF